MNGTSGRAPGRLLCAAPLSGTVLVVVFVWLLQPDAPPRTAEVLEEERAVPSLVVLVRHAERDGPSADDPGLTERGAERAEVLSRALGEAGITAIHATDFVRTRQTAAPLATLLGLEVESFDHTALRSLADAIRNRPGRHLVVGHSNTTDELVVLLGGRSHGPISDGWEYDRLYLLTPAPDGSMTTVLMRYGPISEP
jgi:phosphohistidine phosphatase SixA